MPLAKSIENWFRALIVYADRRMLLLFTLGFSSGLPILLVYSTLGVWLTEVGVQKSTVGAFALVSTPYTFKFLWAPLIDQLRLPVLEKALGRRRSWMLVTQLLLMAAIAALGLTAPHGLTVTLAQFEMHASSSVLPTAIIAVTVAALSATQDIVLDAYRVERLERDEQAAGSAIFVFGYRMGMLIAGAGALFLAAYFQAETFGGVARLLQVDHLAGGLNALASSAGMEAGPWGLAYGVMGLCMLPGILATLFGKEPTSKAATSADGASTGIIGLLYRLVIQPFRTFIASRSQDGLAIAFGVLAFVFMFKLSDALAAVLRNPFLVEIGFTKIQIASIAQTYGMVASIVGALLGGYLVKVLGLTRGLWLSLILMIASNLLFAYQAVLGPDAGFLVFTITVENLTGGFGTAAFVAYLSLLCDVRHTATQYALLTSLSSVGRTIVGSSMGVVAESLGWQAFFGFTAVVGLPALLLLAALHRWGPKSAGLDERYEALNS